jgi:hypothetical protein
MTQDDVRALALSLPEAVEEPHFDRASFRVRGKIFATLPPGGELVVLRLPELVKESLRQSDPQAYVPLPGAWEKGRSTQLAIARMDAEKLIELVRLAWRGVAPKRLVAATGEG